jgi:hypothetical protein
MVLAREGDLLDRLWHRLRVGLLLGCLCAAVAGGQECEPEWAANLFLPPGVSGNVHDAVVWDDGRGPALYLAGSFSSAGGVGTAKIARWDGESWEPLTSITGDQLLGAAVNALAVFDDGGGPELYAGGVFTRAGGLTATNIAKWDGRTWREVEGSLGQGVNGRVDCLHTHTDASGTALYVGGQFDRAGGVSASNIARWDGAEWSRLGAGLGAGVDAAVFALESYDDGDGPDLYVGGGFVAATGVASARRLARWDGAAWSAVGSGADGGIRALHAVEIDGQDYLYVGGSFRTIGDVPASLIARFDGNDWRPIGDGLEGSEVDTILPFDDGLGRSLFVGGSLDRPGSRGEDVGILGWDGESWSAPNGGVSRFVRALAEFQGRLVAGGTFEWTIDGGRMNNVATWGSDGWRSLGNGFTPSTVTALASFDSGDGPTLYVGGNFESAGGRSATGIARWDGAQWLASMPPLRSTSLPRVLCLTPFDDGSGPALYVGGDFFRAEFQVDARHVVRWDGSQWGSVGQGFDSPVNAFAVHDDGQGERLYAAGNFTTSGGAPMSRVARWSGSQWEPLVAEGETGLNGEVFALASWNGDLYAGGQFSAAGSVPVLNIARWNGSEWSAVVLGFNGPVNALATFGDAGSTTLFAAGDFTFAGATRAVGIAQWDGVSWTDIDGGLDGRGKTLAVHDDGNGAALYVAGSFARVGPVDDRVQASGLASWSPSGWRGMADGLTGEILALASHRDDTGSALFAGGSFDQIDGVASARIARRTSCQVACIADFDGDGSLTVFDFLAFQSAFALGDLSADLDSDGALTLFDFLAFQSAFSQGCP